MSATKRYSVEIATSIKYGNYKHLAPNCLRIKGILDRFMQRLSQHIDFRDNVIFKLRPIRGRFTGLAFSKRNLIELDVRHCSLFDPLYLEKILDLICHELVHSEQYNQNRLDFPNTRCALYESKLYKVTSSYSNYYNSPWEVEARTRAKEIVKKVLS